MTDPARFAPITDPRPADAAWPAMRWPIPAQTELTGATVRLTPLRPAADASELYAALDYGPVWTHITGGRPASASVYLERLQRYDAAPDRQHWTVRTIIAVAGLPAGAIVGATSYCDASAKDARLEIGYTHYTPAVWGTAVNPECKLLLLTHAFETLHAGRVQFKCDVRNIRSQQAIARLGASYEGTLRRYQRRADGSVRDTLLFSITAEDWPAARDRLQTRLG